MALTRDDVSAIAATARDLGVDARSLGALFELESGVDPNIWGGAGGKYRGLIQFGPGARKEVGLPSGPMTIQEQLPYVRKYFEQRGFKPGEHGVKELYRTVLVGNPYQGGTDSWGTNADQAAQRMLPGGDLYQRFAKRIAGAAETGAGAGAPESAWMDLDLPAPAVSPRPASALLGTIAASMAAPAGPRMAGDALHVDPLAVAIQSAGGPGQPDPGGMPGAGAAAMPSLEGSDELGVVDLGRRLQGIGFKVAEHPAFGGVGRHSPRSHHYSGNALDLTIQPGSPLLKGRADGEWQALTRQLGAQLKAALPGAEIFHPGDDPVGGHQEHIHLALPKGKIAATPLLMEILRRG